MANITTIKVRKTDTVYGIQDAAASLAIEQMKNGQDIDSFGDVEDALALKAGTTNLDNDDFVCLMVSGQGSEELSSVTINKDSVPTANSQKSIESGAVYTALQGKFPRSEQAVLGTKNLLPYPFANTTKTASGITFTDNDNGSITIGGSSSQTATADAIFLLFKDATTMKAGTYKFTKGFTKSGVQIVIDGFNAGGTWVKNIVASANEDVEATIDYNGYAQVGASLVVKNTTVIDSPITAFPMYRLATDTDPTYAPFAMTNRELTEKVTPKTIPVTTDSRTLTKEGVYKYETIIPIGGSSDINLPTEMENKGVTIVVRHINVGVPTTNTLQQIAYVNNQGYFFMRPCNANTWGAWYKFTGTAV